MALDQDSRTLAHTVAGSASQFISPWKTNLSLQLNGSYRQQPQVLNGALTQTRTRSATAGLRASVSAFAWGSLEYNGTLTALLQDHHAAVSVFAASHHQATLAGDYYDSRGPGPGVQAFFADLTYRYALPTARKIDLELRWTNIFDTRRYQYSSVSTFQLTQTTYQLRPAQVLASVRLSL